MREIIQEQDILDTRSNTFYISGHSLFLDSREQADYICLGVLWQISING